jgi:hypothetical protein
MRKRETTALDLQIGKRIRIRRRQLGMSQTDLVLLSHKVTFGGFCESPKGVDSHWNVGGWDGDRQSEGH